MVGSLLLVVTRVLFEFTGGGGTRAEAILRTVLLNPALLLLIAGLTGFHERQATRSGRLGAVGFAICMLGVGTMLLGNIAEFWVNKYLYGTLGPGWRPGWVMMGYGLTMLPVGFILLGIGALRARVFTAWRRAVPLGFGLMLALIVISRWLAQAEGWWLFFGFAIGWAAFGYTLWSEKTESGENSPNQPGSSEPSRNWT